MSTNVDLTPLSTPPQACKKIPKNAEDDSSKSIDLELGEIKSITSLSEASTAIHVVDTLPVVDARRGSDLGFPCASARATQKELPEEKPTFKNFIKALQVGENGHTSCLIVLYAPTVLAVVWPLARVTTGGSLLEAIMYIMLGFTNIMFWLFYGILSRTGFLSSKDPSKLLLTITGLLYGGLVLGVSCGALLYWTCIDMLRA
ncbi:hypothetical protein EDD36DRAFT_459441 [Exophiala viscosa]|uniref:Uncharacterized protein n=1 Tax=Exophiala viscosa TaxID=2486360 RepID=A0AAN6IHH6_9EURO|nr:hypothetical protein EDD36DRAFT_459441 [Exophiala viscosa]